MKCFFEDNILLNSPSAEMLYKEVCDLPVIDYHCHLNEKEIRDNYRFSDLGELWLAGDHYKWRAMRLCGVDEFFITGDADYHSKYLKYAEIFPKLAGNPLYYWTQLELKLLFDIREPLCTATAEYIREKANRVLADLTVRDILKKFRVEYIATTDDPASSLDAHGTYGQTRVRPTFRPDKALALAPDALERLSAASGTEISSLGDLKSALAARLRFFRSRGCRIADHGMDFLPLPDCGEETASALFLRRDTLSDEEKRVLFSHLLRYLATLYCRENMVMQLHFATFRSVNSSMASHPDTGFDIMRSESDTDLLVSFLDGLNTTEALPKTVLYPLNPACLPALYQRVPRTLTERRTSYENDLSLVR